MVAITRGRLRWETAARSMVRVANRPTPAANPSIPSIRLKALEHPISQATVIAKLSQGQEDSKPNA